jgi:hypothetical protein
MSGNRKERRAARAEGFLDAAAFAKMADKFIALANRESERVLPTELHNAFLFASARYSAFVASAALPASDHEKFVAEMTTKYQLMLRQHLSAPNLAKPQG